MKNALKALLIAMLIVPCMIFFAACKDKSGTKTYLNGTWTVTSITLTAAGEGLAISNISTHIENALEYPFVLSFSEEPAAIASVMFIDFEVSGGIYTFAGNVTRSSKPYYVQNGNVVVQTVVESQPGPAYTDTVMTIQSDTITMKYFIDELHLYTAIFTKNI